MLRAAAHQPHTIIFFRQIAAQPLHISKRAIKLIMVAVWTKRIDITMDAIRANRHARHSIILAVKHFNR